MKMRNLVIAGSIALALASCGSVKNPLQPSLVYDLENAYGIAQASAVAYTKLPRCSATQTIACSKASVVVKLAQYDKYAITALQQLENFTRNPANYPGVSYSALFTAAQSTIGAFTALEASNGVK